MIWAVVLIMITCTTGAGLRNVFQPLHAKVIEVALALTIAHN